MPLVFSFIAKKSDGNLNNGSEVEDLDENFGSDENCAADRAVSVFKFFSHLLKQFPTSNIRNTTKKCGMF
jgi:hypothetical protein